MIKGYQFFDFKNSPLRFSFAVLGSILITIILLIQQYTNHLINQYDFDFSWFDNCMKLLINYWVWVFLLPTIYQLSLLIKGKFELKWLHYIKFLLFSILIAGLHRMVALRLSDLLYFFESGYLKSLTGLNNLTALNAGFFSSLIELWVIVALFIGLDYQKRYVKQQQELAKAQLNALRMQLQPHFLFNTLHSISSMIDIDVKQAQKMITKLGTLLRNVLENDQNQLVTLEEELNFINQYLALEQIRFQEHIDIKHQYSKDLFKAKVPSLILQPLVENAIKHGTIRSGGASEIIVHIDTSEENGRWLIMEIINTYSNENLNESKNKLGIGLKNVKNRLMQLYTEFKFELEPHSSSKGMIARIVIPYSEN